MDPQKGLAPISGLSPASSLSFPDAAPLSAPASSDPTGGPGDSADIQNQKYQQQYMEDLQKQVEALQKKMEGELARGDVESAKQTQTLLEILTQLLGAAGFPSGENSAGAAPGAGGAPGAGAPNAAGGKAPRAPQPAGTPGANRLRKSVEKRIQDPAPEKKTYKAPKDPFENKNPEKKKDEPGKTDHDHDSEDIRKIMRRRRREYLRDVFGHDISDVHRADPDGEKKSWTVMIYNAASDGNIDLSMMNQLKELRGIGNLDNINVVVQQTSSTGFLDSSKPYATRTFALKDGQLQEVKDPETWRDMSSPGSLKDFLKWGMKNYEADHYAVIMGGHGAGVLGAMENRDGNKLMSPEGIRKALEEAKEANGGKKLDMVGFDSCYMGSFEVAHQLRNTADYIVSSEETIGSKGLDYQNILQGIDRNAGGSLHDSRAFVEQFVDASSRNDAVKTLSAVDTSSLGRVDRRLSQLARAINDKDRVPDADFKKFVNAIKDQDMIGRLDENPLFDQFHDMADIARAAQTSGNRYLIQAGNLLSGDLKDAIVANYSADGYEGASGLTLFLPLEKYNLETDTSIIYGYDGARDLRSSRLFDYARNVNPDLNDRNSLPGWQTSVVPGQETPDNSYDPRWTYFRPDDPRWTYFRPDDPRWTYFRPDDPRWTYFRQDDPRWTYFRQGDSRWTYFRPEDMRTASIADGTGPQWWNTGFGWNGAGPAEQNAAPSAIVPSYTGETPAYSPALQPPPESQEQNAFEDKGDKQKSAMPQWLQGIQDPYTMQMALLLWQLIQLLTSLLQPPAAESHASASGAGAHASSHAVAQWIYFR